ncbi:MAG: hypothetical protein K5694_01895, partial [Bacilli bacterium]|nr:hypothetical protein [Bacilli bacterium]
MKDTFISAHLVQEDLIRLSIFSGIPYEKFTVDFLVDGKKAGKLKEVRMTSTYPNLIADYRLDAPLELGHSYQLSIPSFGNIPLDVNDYPSFPAFDSKFADPNARLGSYIENDETHFAIWAPLASKVYLKIRSPKEEDSQYYPMKRGERGTYTKVLKGNLHGYIYTYMITNSEVCNETIDPYAKASTPNSEESVVLDETRFSFDSHDENLPHIESYTDCIIYETSIRDFTIDAHSTIRHKGTYTGFIEEGRKTEGGHPAGFDYLKFLSPTHVQLLPIYDFKTVDELEPEKSYNWGYDPVQYFVPEGSYS